MYPHFSDEGTKNYKRVEERLEPSPSSPRTSAPELPRGQAKIKNTGAVPKKRPSKMKEARKNN